MTGRRKVAIVGSGCAGLGAAWALRHTDCEVHILEKNSKLGGHTNTQTWTKDGESTPVDTGFIVMNTATYPNFINFLSNVGVPTIATEMSFGVCRDHGALEWSGSGKGIFAQRRNIFRPGHWRMIFDVVRFNFFALDLLKRNDEWSRTITIGRYLDGNGYSQAFKDDYLIPMTAAVWSTSPDKASLDFPAQTLVRFLWNHHLLSTLAARPAWLTIPGGTNSYIQAIIDSFPKDRLHIHTSSSVKALVREHEGKGGVRVYCRTGHAASHATDSNYVPTNNGVDDVYNEVFDSVILACHGDEILPILLGLPQSRSDGQAIDPKGHSGLWASQAEIDILNCFQTTENVCYLHSDMSLMARLEDTWSSWNYMIDSQPSKLSHPAGVSLTYNMNILQHIDRERFGDVLVTMNPDHAPSSDLMQGKFLYRHPLYTVEAVRAQEKLDSIQNQHGVSFCGAWTKYGFHEDGFSSGLKVAIDHFGAKLPFEFEDSTYSRGQAPTTAFSDQVVRYVLSAVYLMVWILEKILSIRVIAFSMAIPVAIIAFLFDVLEHYGLVN